MILIWYILLQFNCSLCNTICTSKQWSPEQDPVRLHGLQTTAQEKIEARDAQALELKFTCYPTTRPPGWEPTTQPQIDTDDENDLHQHEHEGDTDYDHYNASVNNNSGARDNLSQHFQDHLLQAEARPNPGLNVMFGHSQMERLSAKSALLQQRRRRGRPRKGEKSSSGGRLPNGFMSQQLNGMTLHRHALGPTHAALKGVTERCGGLLTPEALVTHNIIPGRIHVSGKNPSTSYHLTFNS